MNGSYLLIAETMLLIPLVVWIVVSMCRKEDAQLALWASLITLFFQFIACFIFIRHILAEPFLFFMAFIFCQVLGAFQMETVKGLRSHFLLLRSQPLVISVVFNSLAYTVPWWFLTVCLFKRISGL